MQVFLLVGAIAVNYQLLVLAILSMVARTTMEVLNSEGSAKPVIPLD